MALRVGLASGNAIFDEAEQDWFGTPVVEAARLCAAAPAGATMATGAVVGNEGTGGIRSGWADQGEMRLRGFDQAVRVWERRHIADPGTPGSAVAVPMLAPGMDLDGAPALVGRDGELRLLSGLLDPLDAGPTVVSVVGEPGAGASRLAAEALGRRHAGGGVVVLHAPAAAGRPFLQPLFDAIRWWLSTAGDDDVDRLAGALAPLSPWIELIGLRVATGSASDDPVEDRVERALVALAAAHPLAVLVDDADLLDEASAAVVGRLATGSAPMTLVLAHRLPEPGSPLAALLAKVGDGGVDEVEVAPLGPEASATLAAAVAGPGAADALAGAAGAAAAAATMQPVTGGRPSLLVVLGRQLDRAGGDLAVAAALTQPYRGMLPFGAAERDLFFGRTAMVSRCLEQLSGSGSLVLVGNSGSGKSSLLRAGVLPALDPAAGAVVELRVDPDLAERLAASPPGRSCVVIDQFEELFTAIADPGARDEIAGALLDRRNAGDQLILALRGDFYGHLATVPALLGLVDEASVLVGPPTGVELREAVEGPALLAGIAIEPGLVDLVLRDVADQPGSLPLLSHALYETWNRQRGGILTVSAYRQVGGVEGAIARTADRVFVEQLDAAGQTLARRLLLRLVASSDEGPDARRRLPAADLAALAPAPGGTAVVDRLVAARLITVDDSGAELAHEALLRAWPRLQRWIDEDREGLRQERRIAEQAALWDAGGRQPADLLRGGRLDQALELAASRSDDLTDRERGFIDAGRAQRDREEADTRRQLAVQRRSNRRLRALLAATVAVLLVAAGLGLVARNQRDKADDLAREAAARVLAQQVPTVAADDVTLARLLAAEAHHLDPTVSTEAALLTALTAEGRRQWSVAVAQGALVGATADRVTSVHGDRVTITDPGTGQSATYALQPGASGPVAPPVLSRDGRYLARVGPAGGSGGPEVELLELDEDGATSVGRAAVDAPPATLAFTSDSAELGVSTDSSLVLLRVPDLAPVGGGIPPADSWDTDAAGTLVAAAAPASDARVNVTDSGGVIAVAVSSIVRVHSTETGAELLRFEVIGHAATLALTDDALVVSIERADASGIRRVVEVRDPETGEPLLSTVEGATAFSLGDDRVALSYPNLLVPWDPGAETQAHAPVVTTGSTGLAWTDGDLLFGSGVASVSAWAMDRRQPVTSSPFGPAEVGHVIVAPEGDWAALTVERVDISDGNSLDLDATDLAYLVELGEAAGRRVLGPLPGRADGFLEHEVVVAGGRFTLPGLEETSEPPPADPTEILLAVAADAPVAFLAGVGGARIERFATGSTFDLPLLVEGLDFSGTGPPVLSGDGQRLATYDPSTSTVRILDTETGEQAADPILVDTQLPALALDATGDRLAIERADGRVAGIDLATGDALWPPVPGGGDGVAELVWGDDDGLLLVIDEAGGAHLLDAVAGIALADLLPAGVRTGGFAGGRRTLLLAVVAGTLGIDLDRSAWAEQACAAAGRSLTEAEWERFLPGRPYAPTC
jgi:hypothetical protein